MKSEQTIRRGAIRITTVGLATLALSFFLSPAAFILQAQTPTNAPASDAAAWTEQFARAHAQYNLDPA